MSVNNGQDVSAPVTNAAFVSKTTDSTVVSKVTLNRGASGASIPDTQQAINNLLGANDTQQTQIDNTVTDLNNHKSATSAHGVSGVVVGTTDSQTLTNKVISGGTASATSSIVVPKNTKTNLDARPRVEAEVTYDTTSKRLYYDDGVNLKVVGSGSGGINLITDGDAEGTNPFASYKDAATASPVDGTGGTPSFVTISTSSTTPLAGTKSFVITKSFGNPIGEGVSVPFTVQPAYKARMLKISFDYFASTGFEPPYSIFNSDITVWIYDVTAGKLIQPSNFQILSRDINGTFQADFQSDASSTDYRLILHCGTVNTTAWTFKADNFTIAPSQYVYAPQISASGLPLAFTSTITTNVNKYGVYRTEGDRFYAEIRMDFLGPNTQSASAFTLPYAIDYTKLANGGRRDVGRWTFRQSSTGSIAQGAVYASGTSNDVYLEAFAPNSNIPFAIATTCELNLKLDYPALGLNAVSQVTDGYTALPITLEASGTPSGTVGSTPTNLIYPTVDDKTGSYNPATGAWTCKSAGYFTSTLTGSINSTIGSSGLAIGAQILKGPTIVSFPYLRTFAALTATNYGASAQWGGWLNVGDTLSTRAYSDGTSNGLAGTSWNWSIKKDQAPTTISRGAKTGAGFSSNTARTINNTAPTIIYEIVNYDYTGSYNPTTGEFKTPSAGLYNINGYFRTAAVATSVNNAVLLRVYVQGIHVKTFASNRADSASAITREAGGGTSIQLLQGDIVTFRIYSDTANTTSATTPDSNWITINKAD